MSNKADSRRMRRMLRWQEFVVARVVRRLVKGAGPQPAWLPRRWMTVLSYDLDLDAGVGAIWLVARPRSGRAMTHTALIERCGREWEYAGGGSSDGVGLPAERSAAGRAGQIGMIEIGGASGSASYAYRQQHPHSSEMPPWVEASELQVAAEVDHILLGERRIEVPAHGALIVVWKSPFTGYGGVRPQIVAVGRDGTQLSTLGPHDSMDSSTWARLNDL